MSRLGFGLAFAFVLCVGGPTVAFAQSPGQGPPMPLAVDLAKVPIGSWAEYTMTMGTLPPMTMRMALVAKSPAGNTIETSVEGGMMAAAGKVVTQMTLAPGKEGTVKKMVMQLGANDPMEMPRRGGAGASSSPSPNPKKLVGRRRSRSPAGSFKTKHYRDKTPQGDRSITGSARACRRSGS